MSSPLVYLLVISKGEHMPSKSDNLRRILALLGALGFQWGARGPPSDVHIRRVRAGRHQRSAGAWSWSLAASGLHVSVGSQHTVAECLAMGARGAELYQAQWGDVSICRKPVNSAPASTYQPSNP